MHWIEFLIFMTVIVDIEMDNIDDSDGQTSVIPRC